MKRYNVDGPAPTVRTPDGWHQPKVEYLPGAPSLTTAQAVQVAQRQLTAEIEAELDERIRACCAEFRRIAPRKPVGPSGRVQAELLVLAPGELRAAILDEVST